ncbi:hypothetical protein Pint_19164 [Pistacia integerrima]|uniref:Uncharacterized protein n=1 Tax=Pistacia integerrima TaxID=434235 RepID=A0ACC0YWR6_9ROSI|nr:hypothetical protein Pint_19164 [Pistacia integerrima]
MHCCMMHSSFVEEKRFTEINFLNPIHLYKCEINLLLVVGFYETRIAYYSWRGIQGYRFSAIPDY